MSFDMKKLRSEDIKRLAKSFGADLCGIGNIERWATAPIQMDPKQIMPRAKSIICVGFRVHRGSLRGIEEGTMFSNYSAMGYGGITYLFMPLVVRQLCNVIEDAGYEAMPMGHQSDWREITIDGKDKTAFSKPVAEGKAAPDVMIHMRIAAFLCGVGEIGYSKMLLTPEFGPRVRVGVIITEAELEPDPIIPPGTLCNRCMACANACPGQCISKTETVKVNLAGYDVEWGKLDERGCDAAFTGTHICEEGETGYNYNGPGTRPSEYSPFTQKPKNLYNSGQAICGARGCTRACMISLEKRGVLKNQFYSEFRTEKPWKVDWTDEELAAMADARAAQNERSEQKRKEREEKEYRPLKEKHEEHETD